MKPFSPKGAESNVNNVRFSRAYLRGDFPLVLSHTARGCKLSWKVSVDSLDYHYYLPLLFDGLRETEHPYVFLASNGIEDLLAKGGSKRILPVIPQLIIPIKCRFNCRCALTSW